MFGESRVPILNQVWLPKLVSSSPTHSLCPLGSHVVVLLGVSPQNERSDGTTPPGGSCQAPHALSSRLADETQGDLGSHMLKEQTLPRQLPQPSELYASKT